MIVVEKMYISMYIPDYAEKVSNRRGSVKFS